MVAVEVVMKHDFYGNGDDHLDVHNENDEEEGEWTGEKKGMENNVIIDFPFFCCPSD